MTELLHVHLFDKKNYTSFKHGCIYGCYKILVKLKYILLFYNPFSYTGLKFMIEKIIKMKF